MYPKILKTEAEYDSALARVAELMSAKLGTPEGDALELWSFLVEDYEDREYPIPLPDPVSAIRFRMEQQGLKYADLIPYIGSKSKVSEVLNGKRPLSLTMIRRLHEGLGIPADVLLQELGANLSDEYKGVKWRLFPIAELVKRKWIASFQGTWRDLLENAEEFLGPFLFQEELGSSEAVLLRQHVRSGSALNEYALWAWKARVMQLAKEEDIERFVPGTVSLDFIRDIARLSRLDEGPRLAREYLHKSGIHLVFEKHLPGTHLDGAAMWFGKGAPIIAMTLRYDRLDNFWFTLCHELAHIGRHLAREDSFMFIDDLDAASADKKEKEADKWASDALIPLADWQRLSKKRLSDADVNRIASQLRVHPAVVAGRVRKDKNDYRLMSNLVGQGRVRRLFGMAG